MMPIQALIVDDEPLAREGIRLLLRRDNEIVIHGECANGVQAVETLNNNRVDLLFLDIQMPEMTGFEVLEHISKERLPVIVFVTAYDQFALQAFKAHALDYLLKPYSDKEFFDVLKRAKEYLSLQSLKPLTESLSALLQEVASKQQPQHKYLNRIPAPVKGNIVLIPVDEVDWIEAEDYYASIHTKGTSYLVRETLTNLESRLDPEKFIRIHRSHIVRIDMIKEMRPFFDGDSVVILHNGVKLTLGKTYKQKLKKFLNIAG